MVDIKINAKNISKFIKKTISAGIYIDDNRLLPIFSKEVEILNLGNFGF